MKTQMMRRITATVLACIMTVSVSACGYAGTDSSAPGGGRWVDSDVTGQVKAEDVIRPQDDFAAAVNQPWIIDSMQDEAVVKGSIMDASVLLKERIMGLINDTGNTSHDSELLKTFAGLVLDWNTRNELGVSPIEPYLDAIDGISSIDELTAFQASPEKNPFNLGLLMPIGVITKQQYPDQTTLALSAPGLSLGAASDYSDFSGATLEAKEKNDLMIKYLLGRLGVDEKEAERILTENYKIEAFIARNQHTDDYSDKEMIENVETDRETLAKYAYGYPIFEIIDGRGYEGMDALNVDYMYLSSLSAIYNDENLESLKSFLKVSLLNDSVFFLDRETLDRYMENSISWTEKQPESDEADDGDILKDTINYGGFLPLLDELYLEKYFPDSSKEEEILELIDEIIGSYRVMISEEDWMDDEVKELALDKLDNMVINSVRPDNVPDYSDVELKSYADGGTLMDAIAIGQRKALKHENEKAAKKEIERGYWDIYDTGKSTTTINSFYYPQQNAFYILSGFVCVSDAIFGDDPDFEELAGGIGAVIGHEISHGFDSSGSHYDNYGRNLDDSGHIIDWMGIQGRSRLDEKATRLAGYFSLVRPMPDMNKVTGSVVRDEAIADMAGIKALLYAAKNHPDFDYDKFFRSYAALWRSQTSGESEKLSANDVHPLNYLRVNITLQQYDEFMETYDIKPEDGMYLAPDRRINVW